MTLTDYLQKQGFKEHREFDLRLLTFTQEVRDLCRKNTCGQYQKNHMCPPAIADMTHWKNEISSYQHAFIVSKAYPIKSSFDLKGMTEGAGDFGRSLALVRQSLQLDFPSRKHLVLGAGSCRICKECSLVINEPCRFPEQAFPSVEACGIDVMSLSKSAGVKYNNGVNTVTYLGLILY